MVHELWNSRCSSWIWKRQWNQRSNCQHLLDHRKSKRVPEKHLALLYWLCQSVVDTVWITTHCGKFFKRWEYQTTLPASWEMCMEVKKPQLELDTNSLLDTWFARIFSYAEDFLFIFLILSFDVQKFLILMCLGVMYKKSSLKPRTWNFFLMFSSSSYDFSSHI